MRALVSVLSVLVAASAASVLAAPAGPPQRKAGWWEITTQMAAPMAMTQKMNFCTDAATEARNSALAGNMQSQGDCTQGPIARTPGGWSFSSTCKMQGMTMTTSGTATGDFQSNYRVDATTKMEPAPMPQMAQSRMTITAKWLGACPAGRKPGDMVMGNGMVMNMNSAGRR